MSTCFQQPLVYLISLLCIKGNLRGGKEFIFLQLQQQETEETFHGKQRIFWETDDFLQGKSKLRYLLGTAETRHGG